MAMKYRLSAIACQEMLEAKIQADILSERIERALEDGKITLAELDDIRHEKAELDREIGEALVAAERSDNVLRHFEHACKVGMDAPAHQYIAEHDRDLARLRAQYGQAGPNDWDRPTPTQGGVVLRWTGKRKAPMVDGARQVRSARK